MNIKKRPFGVFFSVKSEKCPINFIMGLIVHLPVVQWRENIHTVFYFMLVLHQPLWL